MPLCTAAIVTRNVVTTASTAEKVVNHHDLTGQCSPLLRVVSQYRATFRIRRKSVRSLCESGSKCLETAAVIPARFSFAHSSNKTETEKPGPGTRRQQHSDSVVAPLSAAVAHVDISKTKLKHSPCCGDRHGNMYMSSSSSLGRGVMIGLRLAGTGILSDRSRTQMTSLHSIIMFHPVSCCAYRSYSVDPKNTAGKPSQDTASSTNHDETEGGEVNETPQTSAAGDSDGFTSEKLAKKTRLYHQQQKQRDEEEDSQFESIFKQMQSLPNIITMTRIASTPIISYLIITDRYCLALYGCLAFGFTDWLDGYIAKRYNMTTVLGTYLDPLADKIMVNVLAASLWYTTVLPGPVVALWMSRDVILISAAYHRASSVTKEGDDVMNPAKTPLKVQPTMISKVNTVMQFMTIAGGMAHALYAIPSLDVVLGLCWASAGTTMASLLSYADGEAMIASGNKFRDKVRSRTVALRDKARERVKLKRKR